MRRDDMLQVIEKVAPNGWHIAMHLGGHGVLDYYDFITSIEAPVVIDHIGRIERPKGCMAKPSRCCAVCSTAEPQQSHPEARSGAIYPPSGAVAQPRLHQSRGGLLRHGRKVLP